MSIQVLRIYLAVLGTNRKVDKNFFWDNILYSIRTMIEPVVLFMFWGTVAQYSTVTSPGSMAIYFICYAFVDRLTCTWIGGDFMDLIKAGDLSKELLTPVPGGFVAGKLLRELSVKKMRLLVTIPATIALVVALSYYLPLVFPPWHQLAFFPLVVLCGWIIQFCFWFSVSCASLWLHHIEGISEFVEAMMPFFDGSYIPLVFLSGSFAQIFKLLPFRYIISFPLEILSINLNDDALLFGVSIMLLWTCILIAISTLVWRKGLKAYQG